MIDIIGWIASFLFSFCGAPQAYLSYKNGNSNGVSSLLLFMWGSGELLMILYVLVKYGIDMPLLLNYILNLIFIMIILKYKLFPRRMYDSK